MSVIKLLEDIANSYLQVLAEGGIQLALEGDNIHFFNNHYQHCCPLSSLKYIIKVLLGGDISSYLHIHLLTNWFTSQSLVFSHYLQGDELDKIVKSVMVRSADGSFRERGLSQLSGGQWRRVSMALDFAFAEIIRRKGSLRSNLIVMDEVLTHLDSSGREAVGSVLRAMVDNTRSLSPTPGGLGTAGGDASLEGGGGEGEELMIDEERMGGAGAEKALRSKAEALAISRALIGQSRCLTVYIIPYLAVLSSVTLIRPHIFLHSRWRVIRDSPRHPPRFSSDRTRRSI